MQLTKGANAPIPHEPATCRLTFGKRPSGVDMDVSAYLLRADGKVRGDADMVFYNQTSDPANAVKLDVATNTFTIDIDRVPTEVERITMCIVVDRGSVAALSTLRLEAAGHAFDHDLSDATEAAMIVGELYRRQGAWKFRAVAQGFNGGMAPLARSFGMDVDETKSGATTPPTAQRAPAATPPSPPISLSKIDLRKHKVGVSLAKHGMSDERADVLMVIDASGSMASLYMDGTVQETVERIVPVALRLDDDGQLDTYFYASECRQVDPLNVATMAGFIKREMPHPGYTPSGRGGFLARKNGAIGYGNNEPVVMKAILQNEPRSRTKPLLVIFVTDGGIDGATSNVIKDILRKSSKQAIFWQYVGVGNANYGVLRDLDTIDGRVVDNAGFFAIDDLSRITDDDLYDRLLSEFPAWLKAARNAGILAV